MFGFHHTCREAGLTASRIRLTQPRPVFGQAVLGIEHHVLAVVQRILPQILPWNGNASQPHYSLLWTGSPARSALDAIRRGGVPYAYGEIEHDVIAALMRT
jgi:hypothetical protein